MKTVGAIAAFATTGMPVRVAAAAALALAQVGEFSLLFGGSPIPPASLRAATAAGARRQYFTMMAAPALVALAPGSACAWRDGGLQPAGRRQHRSADDRSRGDPRVRAGGRLVARALHDIGVEFLVLDLNGRTVQKAAAGGEPLVYADVTAPDALEAAHVATAAAVVAVLSDPDATERAVQSIRTLSPSVPIVARTRYRLEADRLRRAGATVAVAEEIETSFEVLAQLLARLEVPGNIAEVLLGTYRTATYADPVRSIRAAPLPFDALPAELSAAPVALFRVPNDAWAIGRTLADIDLRADNTN